MSKELDDVLLEMKKRDMVAELLQSFGATHEAADLATQPGSKILKEFKLSAGGGVLGFQGHPLMAKDAGAAVKQWLVENKYDFLLPPPEPDPVKALKIDPADLALAKAGNLTAKGRVFLACGKDQAAMDAALAGGSVETGDAPAVDAAVKQARDASTNPWAAANWNVTKQAQLVRAMGVERANQIAAAVGSRVGDTKPARAA